MSSGAPIQPSQQDLPSEQDRSPQERLPDEPKRVEEQQLQQPSERPTRWEKDGSGTPGTSATAGTAEQASRLYALQLEAEASGNRKLADRYKQEQTNLAVLNQGLVQAQGLPSSTPIETSEVVDPNIEIWRMMYSYMEKSSALDEVLERHDFQGRGLQFDAMVMQPYKERNAEKLVEESETMSVEDRIKMMQQLEPVVVDPNWSADMRQWLTKVDIDMKAIDKNFSVFKHPKTKRLANWIARETGPLTPGYMKSGEQLGGRAEGGTTMAIGEGIADFGLGALWGTVDLAAKAVKAVAGEAYGLPWAVATNYVEDENGNLVNNGGKVPGLVDTIAAVNARVLGENVREYVARVGKAREFEALSLNGFDRIVRGSASIMGMGFGFGLPAGAAMHTGQALAVGGRIGGGSAGIGKFSFTAPSIEFSGLLNGGLMRLAASGASSRMVKLSKVIGGTAGAAVANGLAEGAAFGRADGYASAFVHGMAMAPVLMGLGWLGRKSESVLSRNHMPAGMARAISGGLEGVGFGSLEAGQVGALWKLMQDPSNETWEIYAKNMLGFAIFKGAFGRSVVPTPGFGEAQGRQMLRQGARQKLAEDVSRADEGELLRQADETIVAKGETEARIRETQGELETRVTQVEGREPMPDDIRAIREKDKIWRTKEESQRLADWTIGAERQRFEAFEPERGETRGEQVEGKEPDVAEPKEAKEQVKGVLRGPEIMMELGPTFGEKMTEGKRVKTEDVSAARTKKAESQGRDPLEDISFGKRPREQQEAILERRTAKERRETAESFEGPERRSGERREPPRMSAKELATEIQRLRAQGPSPENRARIVELMKQERGRVTEGAGELFGAVSRAMDVGVGRKTSRPAQRRAGPEPIPKDLEARILASGVPRETLRKLGDISRARRAARSPQEAAELWRRQLELEQELDALEMAQDPVMNATMREALREFEVRELDAPVQPSQVDPVFGERFGPESSRAPANPHRQQENLLRPGEKPVRASDIINVLKGRSGFPGVRIFGRRLGRIPGSAVQVAIRAGRVHGRGTAGVFKIFENLTRTKAGMDLVVALHEWSHAMQRQVLIGQGGEAFSRGVRKWLKGQSDETLADMATILRNYPGSQKLPLWVVGAEAWAEWHARNLLGDATLREEVPSLSKVMDAWLMKRTDLLPQYREVIELVDVYKRQGSRLRVRESIQRGLARKQGSVAEQVIGSGEKVWDRVVKSFFDDMHLLKKSQRKWLSLSDVKIQDLSILDDPARLYDTLAMTASKQAESFIRRGTHNLALERTGEGLEKIMNDVGNGLKGTAKNEKTIDFIDYVVSTRAIDLIGKGKPQTLPLSDYLQAQKELITANPEFAGLSARLKVWTDALLDLVAEAGNVPQKDVQAMKDYSVVYLPFVRAMDGVVTTRGTRGVAEKGNALKSLKGDTREISDPMQAMFETTTAMIAKAHQQMVMKALYKVMLRADVGGLATRVERTNVPSEFRLDQVVRQMEPVVLEKMQKLATEGTKKQQREMQQAAEAMAEAFEILGELAKAGELSDDVVTLFGQKLVPYGEAANIVAYTPRLTATEISTLPRHAQVQAKKWNGSMQWLELDPHAYTALMGLDKPIGPTFMDNAIMKWVFGKPAKVLRFFATDANPAFVAANAIRDMASAAAFDPDGRFHPYSGVTRFIEGAAIMVSQEPGRRVIADMYEASGARTASIYNEGVRREMRGEVVGKLGATRETILKARDWWTGKLAGPESFIRVAQFKRVYEKALADGKGKVEAVMEALEGAKEITINFARAGALARAYNQMTPYFSASLAGQRKLLRALTGMEGRTDAERSRLQKAALMNGLFGLTAPGMAAWALVKDEKWFQDLPEWRRRHFINFRLPGSDTVLSLPLPFELGTIFVTMPQILGDHLTDSNPINFMETFAESMFPYLRGLGSALPAGAKPILEAASGYDFFTQRKLTPYYIEQNNPPPEQMRPGTTMTAQGAFKLLQKVGVEYFLDNPIELEQVLAGYTAGASTAFMRWTDETFSLKDHPGVRPGIEAVYGTFLNRFARQTVHGSSRAVDEFYNKLARRIEQQARNEKTRSPALRRSLRMIQRDKNRMSEIRRSVRAGEMTMAEGDRLLYEIAQAALEREER